MASSKKVIKRWAGKNEELSEVVRKLCSDIHCVVEASPLAESVCRLIEAIGGTIEIIDSRHAKALLNGKKKTDRMMLRC